MDLPRKTTHVNFITDIDSISFKMNYGKTKDFIVLLNDKDSCYTQISANYPNLKMPKKVKQGNDTIPFTMKDNGMYFKGKINDSDVLNIQFDLGADAVNLNKKSSKKIKINFDKKGNLVNSLYKMISEIKRLGWLKQSIKERKLTTFPLCYMP